MGDFTLEDNPANDQDYIKSKAVEDILGHIITFQPTLGIH
jgi:hypothetical protein